MQTDEGASLRPAFSPAPDPRAYFPAEAFEAARATLGEGVRRADGFLLLIGAAGSGKTTLAETVIADARSRDLAIGRIAARAVHGEAIAPFILSAYDVEAVRPGAAGAFDAARAFLARLAGQGRRALLAVDDADALSPQAFETLRALSDQDGAAALQTLLVVDAERCGAECAGALARLRPRIIAACELRALSALETRAYVEHRLARGGETGAAFSAEAFDRLYAESCGRPGLINACCRRAIEIAAKEGRLTVDAGDIARAATEGGYFPPLARAQAAAPERKPAREAEPPGRRGKKQRQGQPRESLFDRLWTRRAEARKETRGDTQDADANDADMGAATLNDVAKAIAAVSAVDRVGQDGADEEGAPKTPGDGSPVRKPGEAPLRRALKEARGDLVAAAEAIDRVDGEEGVRKSDRGVMRNRILAAAGRADGALAAGAAARKNG